MNIGSRYLYRYIIFAIVEVANDALSLIWNLMSGETEKHFMGFMVVIIYLAMTSWRILEVTVLNNYFNSLKKKKQP